jgi:hypothetical protein
LIVNTKLAATTAQKVTPQAVRVSSKIAQHRVAVGRRHDITADLAKSLTYAEQGLAASFQLFVGSNFDVFRRAAHRIGAMRANIRCDGSSGYEARSQSMKYVKKTLTRPIQNRFTTSDQKIIAVDQKLLELVNHFRYQAMRKHGRNYCARSANIRQLNKRDLRLTRGDGRLF